MVETIEKRTFGLEGRQFCLEIHSFESGDRKLTLSKNGEKLTGENVQRRTLQVLERLTSEPQKTIGRSTILQDVWGQQATASGELDPSGHIDRHIHSLREVFEDDSNPKKSKFIKTEQSVGIVFLLPVERAIENVPQAGSAKELRGVLNVLKKHPCHRYHLTLGKKGEPVWIYSLIDFTKNEQGQKLVAQAPVVLMANATDADRAMNMYDFEALPYGSHLLIKSRRSDGSSDMSVDLYPHADTQHLPFCGARINDTWFPTTVASSISFLSIGSALAKTFESVREGPIEDPQLVSELEQRWREGSKIVRLPADWLGTPDAQRAFGPQLVRPAVRDPRALFKVDVPYYHYHLTLNKKREPVWICKIINWQVDKHGHLFAHTPILPLRGATPADHLYEITPTFLGEHLVIQLKRFGSESDMTVQLYPYADSSQLPSLYGATINRTQTSVFVSSIVILSTDPVGGETEGPVDEEHTAKLLAAWGKHAETGSPEIVRLPFFPGRPEHQGTSEDIVVSYAGNDFEASKYTSSQHPLLKQIRDTHVFSDSGDEQFDDQETYELLSTGITTFLTRPNTHFTWVVGHRVDKRYIEHVIEAVEAAAKASGKSVDQIERKITCYRLRSVTAAVTNFLILDYKEEGKGKEVVFGWGHHSKGTSGKVFRSADDAIVRELEAAFTNLCLEEMSVQVPLRSLLDAQGPHSEASRFQERWDFLRVEKMLRASPVDAEIKILISFFVDDVQLFDMLDDLLIRNNSRRKMQIIMMSPNEPELLERRYNYRDGYTGEWELAQRELSGQLERFSRYQERLAKVPGEHGSLDIRTHRTVPTLVSYQIADEMLIGMLLTKKAFDDAPMFLVKKGEYLWGVFEENYDACLEASDPYKSKKQL